MSDFFVVLRIVLEIGFGWGCAFAFVLCFFMFRVNSVSLTYHTPLASFSLRVNWSGQYFGVHEFSCVCACVFPLIFYILASLSLMTGDMLVPWDKRVHLKYGILPEPHSPTKRHTRNITTTQEKLHR